MPRRGDGEQQQQRRHHRPGAVVMILTKEPLNRTDGELAGKMEMNTRLRASSPHNSEGDMVLLHSGEPGTAERVPQKRRLPSPQPPSNGHHATRDSSPASSPSPGKKKKRPNTPLGKEQMPVARGPFYQPSSDTAPTAPQDGRNDFYCWVCHREGQVLCCELCPRVYHAKCLKLAAEPEGDWFCPECEKVTVAECIETQSKAMSMLTTDQLSYLLKFALQRMKHTGTEPFQKPVSLEQHPDYTEYIFNPMDLSTLERNIKKKIYGCTEAFLADCKWILHNCIIYNGANHKLTTTAKMIIKICEHEMNEIEVCPECYLSSCQKRDNWFCEPCSIPHPLVWAKLKGFPFWPAKALRERDGQVDVRFFGQHDRAWVPVSNCYLMSKEIPFSVKKARGIFNNAMSEMEVYVENIRRRFGLFNYAQYRTPYTPDTRFQILRDPGSGMQPSPDEEVERGKLSFDMAASPKVVLSRLGMSGGSLGYGGHASSVGTRSPLSNVSSVPTGSDAETEGDRGSPSTLKGSLKVESPGSSISSSSRNVIPKSEKLSRTSPASSILNLKLDRSKAEMDLEALSETVQQSAAPVAMAPSPKKQIKNSFFLNLDKTIANCKASLGIKKMASEEQSDWEMSENSSESEADSVAEDDDERGLAARRARRVAASAASAPGALGADGRGRGLGGGAIAQGDGGGNSAGREETAASDSGGVKQDLSQNGNMSARQDKAGKEKPSGRRDAASSSPSDADEKQAHRSLRVRAAPCKEEDDDDGDDDDDDDPDSPHSLGLDSDSESELVIDLGEESRDERGAPPPSSRRKGRNGETGKQTSRSPPRKEAPSNSTQRSTNNRASSSAGPPPAAKLLEPSSTGKEKTSTANPKPSSSSSFSSPSASPSITSPPAIVSTSSVTPATPATVAVVSPIKKQRLLLPKDSAAGQGTTPSGSAAAAAATATTSTTTTTRSSSWAVPGKFQTSSQKWHNQRMQRQQQQQREGMGSRYATRQATKATQEKDILPAPPPKSTPTVTTATVTLVTSSFSGATSSAGSRKLPATGEGGGGGGAGGAAGGAGGANIPPLSKAETTSVGSNSAEVAADIAKYTSKQMMEAIKGTVTEMYNDLSSGSSGNTLAEIRKLRIEIEKLQWLHQQELLEMKHNAELTMAEMRQSFEQERDRLMGEVRKQTEIEKLAVVEETKKKQWCAYCRKEAIFYCCWNTSYCDYPCQQAHWPEHMKTCTQSGGAQPAHLASTQPEVEAEAVPETAVKVTAQQVATATSTATHTEGKVAAAVVVAAAATAMGVKEQVKDKGQENVTVKFIPTSPTAQIVTSVSTNQPIKLIPVQPQTTFIQTTQPTIAIPVVMGTAVRQGVQYVQTSMPLQVRRL
ncbi:MYND-type zinc finger-containing chromatin reader ZMYND8-like isoform X10 [Lampetra planeri]